MEYLKHTVPMWVWEILVILSYVGLFIISALLIVIVIGEDEDE